MMRHIDNHVLAIDDAADRSSEIRQRDVLTIHHVSGRGGRTQGLHLTVGAAAESQRPAFGGRQSQVYEIDLVHFRYRPEVGCGREAQS